MCAFIARLLPGRRDAMPIEAIEAHPHLAAMLDLWSRHRAEGRLPRRLDPLEMPRRLLPYLMLLDMERAPDSLRIRLAGTRLCESFGREMRGLAMEDLFEGEGASAVLAGALRIADHPRPHLATQSYTKAGDGAWRYTHLLLPLSADGTHVTQILMAIDPATFRYEREHPGSRSRF